MQLQLSIHFLGVVAPPPEETLPPTEEPPVFPPVSQPPQSCEQLEHVSKSLKELLDKGLIICKNPDDKFYRFYELTKKGREIIKELK